MTRKSLYAETLRLHRAEMREVSGMRRWARSFKYRHSSWLSVSAIVRGMPRRRAAPRFVAGPDGSRKGT